MTQKLFRWISLLILVLFLSGAGLASAAKEQIYTIKKGDTLWDLSQRFIDDPYYWPNVWAKNSEITNPHLIFPGQKIRILDGKLEIIPAYPGKDQDTEAATQSKVAVPITESPQQNLITVRSTGSGDGFIRTTEESLGVIVDSVDNRILLTEDDTVFVKMKDTSGVTVGYTYSLFEKSDVVVNPETKEKIGTMMKNLGSLQVTEVNKDTVVAKIDRTYREVTRGAELFEFIPHEKDITLKHGIGELKGYLIAARDEKSALSTGDVIFINLGRADGLEKGNLFYISRPRKASDEIKRQAGDVQLPDAVLGAAVVIETRDHTASAIIFKSVDASHVGDKITVVAN